MNRRARSAPGLGELVRDRWDVLGVIAAGGAIGSLARWGLAEVIPHAPSQVPYSTLLANVVGSFLLGALMVFVLEVWPPGRHLRPFVGVGVLGGFTTFSTFMSDTHELATTGEVASMAAYVVATVVLVLLAVAAGVFGARALAQALHRRRARAARAGDEPETE